MIYLAIERLFYGIPLADRPLLLLGALLFVLGIQIFATGLIGELIIFTHAKELKEYNPDATFPTIVVERVVVGADAEKIKEALEQE